MKLTRLIVAMAAVAAMSGCAATQVALTHHALNVQSKMTNSIFLDPSTAKTVFVQVKNTSDKPNLDVTSALDTDLQAEGFTVVTNPDQAEYELQLDVLQVGKGDPSASQIASGGFGAPLNGAISAAGSLAALSGHVTGHELGVAGIAGGAADYLAGALVKDVTFSAITDVQVSQRSATPVKVSGSQALAQGSSGTAQTFFHTTSQFKRYRTRVYSTANKVDLKWNQAAHALVASLAHSVSGIL